MFVNAGYIIGFDTEADGVAEGIIDCIEHTGIPINMAGLLFALPTTQLARRLKAEGRLHEDFDHQPDGVGDQCTSGLNYVTLRPRADILRDYLKVVETVYEPEKFFARVLDVGLVLDSSKRKFRPSFGLWLKELRAFGRMIAKLGTAKGTRGYFWRVFAKALLKNPRSIRYTMSMMALYLHFGPFSKYVADRLRNDIEKEAAWQRAHPETLAAAPVAS
jgi:hypothetical protein